ncbi:hypothetical protein QBC39DRAFT_333915 [Podospora conica]|nr:hypothetical protein QBC39DRAFT_333915 [Schizothecium conicum]
MSPSDTSPQSDTRGQRWQILHKSRQQKPISRAANKSLDKDGGPPDTKRSPPASLTHEPAPAEALSRLTDVGPNACHDTLRWPISLELHVCPQQCPPPPPVSVRPRQLWSPVSNSSSSVPPPPPSDGSVEAPSQPSRLVTPGKGRRQTKASTCLGCASSFESRNQHLEAKGHMRHAGSPGKALGTPSERMAASD